jgi:hypothetical protein
MEWRDKTTHACADQSHGAIVGTHSSSRNSSSRGLIMTRAHLAQDTSMEEENTAHLQGVAFGLAGGAEVAVEVELDNTLEVAREDDRWARSTRCRSRARFAVRYGVFLLPFLISSYNSVVSAAGQRRSLSQCRPCCCLVVEAPCSSKVAHY